MTRNAGLFDMRDPLWSENEATSIYVGRTPSAAAAARTPASVLAILFGQIPRCVNRKPGPRPAQAILGPLRRDEMTAQFASVGQARNR